MRRAVLVVLLFCVCPVLGRAHSDRNRRDRPGEDDGGRQISFEARLDFPTADNPRALATGDFNRDGVLDIATVSPGSTPDAVPDIVTVLLGTGDGKFRRAPDLSLSPNAMAVAIVAADFDGDGRLDLAILMQRGRSIVILSGRGDGTFAPTLTVPVGENPVALVSADFNGDGRPDLAALNQPSGGPLLPPGSAPGNITLSIAQTAGGFQSTTVPVGVNPTAMATGDFNGDGRSDLAVVSLNAVTILLGGNLQSTPDLRIPVAALIAAGDVDGDGRLDLAVADSRFGATVFLLIGRGDGTFRPGQTLPVTPQAPILTSASFATAIAIGDFNHDSRPDVAVTDSSNAIVTLLVGVVDGTLQAGPGLSVGSRPVAIAAGDFDADGGLDLATAGNSSTVSILAARPGGFHLAPAYPVGCCPSSLVTGDFNEDGRIDLVAANFPDRSVTALLGTGGGRFAPAAPSAVLRNPSRMASADFNRDGHLDLAMSNEGSNTVSIALGRGDGTFQLGQVITVASTPYAIVTADFDEDGVPDLAVGNDLSFSVSILRGAGNGTFVPAATIAVNLNPLDIALTDANRDGHFDLIVANTNQNGDNQTGSLSVLLGHGDGTFASLPLMIVGVRPISVAVADFNGDLIPDLAVLNQFGSPPLSLLLGRGDGTFFSGTDLIVKGDHVIAGDFDADGRTDLAIVSTNNYVALWLGNGDGTFDPGPLLGTGDEPRTVIAGDFDQDGLLDLATGNYNARTVSVLINTSEPDRPASTAAARRWPRARPVGTTR